MDPMHWHEAMHISPGLLRNTPAHFHLETTSGRGQLFRLWPLVCRWWHSRHHWRWLHWERGKVPLSVLTTVLSDGRSVGLLAIGSDNAPTNVIRDIHSRLVRPNDVCQEEEKKDSATIFSIAKIIYAQYRRIMIIKPLLVLLFIAINN